MPPRLVLLVHGYGWDERRMTALAPALDPEQRFTIAAPRGPIERPRQGGAAWMLSRRRRPEQFAASLELLCGYLDRQCAVLGTRVEDAVVGGFSQGAILAFALATHPDRPRPAAVVSWSGVLPLERGVDVDLTRLAGVPVLFQAGVHDDVIPIRVQRAAGRRLGAVGAHVTAYEYDAGHEVSPAALADARRWLAGLA